MQVREFGRRIAFGPFVADGPGRRLWHQDRSVPLTPKAFALLWLLASRPGELVTKAELFDSVWAGSAVSDAAMARLLRELRTALGDDAAEPRYVETAHGQGLRFIASVDRPAVPMGASVQAPGQPPPGTAMGGMPGSVAASPVDGRAAPLFGRASEIAHLQQALARAEAGRRQLVFISGEAGIGKSSLVRRFIEEHLPPQRAVAAQGRCIEQYGSREPYLPLRECLERLAAALGSATLRDTLSQYAPSWLAQLPWLLANGEVPTLPDAEASSLRLLRELAQSLEALGNGRCLVLWVEDLHWCDPSTLDALNFLVGRSEPARLLILATVRTGQAAAGDRPLRALMQRSVQQQTALHLALGPLSPQAVQQVVAARLGQESSRHLAGLAELLHRRADGNALFIEALLNDLIERGELGRAGPAEEGWVLTAPLAALADSVPDSLRELVRLQVGPLDPADRRLLSAAAVAGESFCAAAVAAAVEAPLQDVEEACHQLALHRRFVRPMPTLAWPDGTTSAGYRFEHALVRQALHDDTSPARRAEFQLRIARRLERAWHDGLDLIASELAMRYEAGGERARALDLLRRAGTAALERCAYVEAIDQLRHGLSLLPNLATADRDRAELDLLMPLGAAQMAAQGYADTEVLAVYTRALELCRQQGAPGPTVRALRGLWNVALVRGDLAQAHRLGNELAALAALAEPAARPVQVFDAEAKLGQTCLHRGQIAQARVHLERALEQAVPPTHPLALRERPRVLAYLSWALWYGGDAEQALQRGREAVEAAGTDAGAHSTAFALGFVTFLQWFCGRRDAALELAQRQHALSAEHGLRYWLAWSRFTCALAAAQAPPQVQALDAMQQAIDEFRDMNAEVGLPHFLDLYAQACLESGALDRCEQAIEVAMSMAQRNGNLYQLPETLRLRGEMQAQRAGRLSGPLAPEVEHCLQQAIEIATQQRSPALVQRAAASRDRLRGQGHTRL